MLSRLIVWWRKRSLRQTVASTPAAVPAGRPTRTKAQTTPLTARADVPERPPLEQTVRIEEVADAAVAARLFRRAFGREIPRFPRHFVALIGRQCVGYVHYTAWQGDYLVGGLCIDKRAYTTLTEQQRSWLHDRGGIAEILLRTSHAALSDSVALWDYVFDDSARAINQRIGFTAVDEPYLYVLWQKPLSDRAKQLRVEAARALGAF